jgi:flagellar hook-basal body complex protein FliE
MDLRLTPLTAQNLQALRQARPAGPAAGGGAAATGQADFAQAMKAALRNVSAAQNEASELQTQVQLGNPNVSLEQTMLAMQKSQVGFQAALHVRNRMMQAYTDVMNMQV